GETQTARLDPPGLVRILRTAAGIAKGQGPIPEGVGAAQEPEGVRDENPVDEQKGVGVGVRFDQPRTLRLELWVDVLLEGLLGLQHMLIAVHDQYPRRLLLTP